MKAEIKKDGCIWVTAETVAEAFALQHLTPLEVMCDCKTPLVIDATILTQE